MGFSESAIQQAFARANSSGRLLHLNAIIEMLVAANNESSNTQPKRLAPKASENRMQPSNPLAVTLSSISNQPRSAFVSQSRVPAAGGASAALLASAATSIPESGQLEIKTGTLGKQRHIWGFAIQSLERVEVHVVVHEGRAKLRYFDLESGALRRTLLLEGCRIERGTVSMLGFAASCFLRVHLAGSRPFANISLFCDSDAHASEWQHAMQDAVSRTQAATSLHPSDSLHALLIPTIPAAALAQCPICMCEITSQSEAVCCPTGEHFVHKGECFDSCVESQIAVARADPGQFHSRGSKICCPSGYHRGGAWCDADIKRHCKRDTWQVKQLIVCTCLCSNNKCTQKDRLVAP